MSILTWLAKSSLGKFFFEFLLQRVLGAIKDAFNAWKENRKIKKQAKESMKALEKAKTGKEIDDAFDKAFDDVF